MLLRVAGWRALSAHSDPFQTTIKKTSRLVIAARLLAGSGMGPKTFFIVPTRVAVDTKKPYFRSKLDQAEFIKNIAAILVITVF